MNFREFLTEASPALSVKNFAAQMKKAGYPVKEVDSFHFKVGKYRASEYQWTLYQAEVNGEVVYFGVEQTGTLNKNSDLKWKLSGLTADKNANNLKGYHGTEGVDDERVWWDRTVPKVQWAFKRWHHKKPQVDDIVAGLQENF